MKVTFALLSVMAIAAAVVFGVLVARAPHDRGLQVAFGVTDGLAVAGFFFLLFGVVFPKTIFRAPGEAREARVRAVRASGPALAEADVSGSLGAFNAGAKMLHVEVRPDGLILKVTFVGTAAVRRDEIRSVEEKRQLWARYIEIEHAGAQVVSPIRLQCSRDVLLSQALKSFAAPAA